MQPNLQKRRLKFMTSSVKNVNQKGVIIYRVSSVGQAKEGWSLEAQRKYLREHAQKHNIEIVREFEEQQSAKRAGRKVFNEMIKYLKQHRNVTNILVEKTDRLYRNFRDYVTLDEMGVNLHFVKENTVICPQSRSHEKFIHGIKVLIAKNFIDNLREETTKGQREKAEEGYYPGGCSAIGYKNVKNAEGKKIIVPDEERAFFVRRAFTLYNTGSISMRKLAQKLSMEGFTTKKGYPINHKSIEHILQNPIYMGEFYWAGKLYKGKHKPLIDKKLYNDVQKMFLNPLRSKERKEEATYTGIFRCGACGKMITVERQKGAHKSGDYIYYRCGNNECKQHYYINEIKLDKFIAEILKDININPEYEPLIQKNLIELHKIKTSEETVRLKRIHKEIDETKYLSNNLLDKYLEGKINDEIYQTKSKELTSRLEDLEVELDSLNKNQDNFEEYTKNLLELSKEAPHLYSRATKQNKKNLLKLVSLNPTIESGKPVIELHPVFQNIKKFSFGKLNVVGGT